MTTKDEWIKEMIKAGAIDPNKVSSKVSTVYADTYLEQFEFIDIAWVISGKEPIETQEQLIKENMRTRNKFARNMRKDNWEVACASSWNPWDNFVIQLSAHRPHQKTATKQTTIIATGETP